MDQSLRQQPNRPFQIGIGRSKLLPADFDDASPIQRLDAGKTLAALTETGRLFTYAPLILYGGMEHEPIAEWRNTQERPAKVLMYMLPERVLVISADKPVWDSILWYCEEAGWDALALHLGSMAFIDRGRRKLTRVICQQLTISDYVAVRDSAGVASSRNMPTVSIYTFSVDSNQGCLAFVPSHNPLGKPRLRFYRPREETVKLADSLFEFDPNPYQCVQAKPWESTDETDTARSETD